LLQIKYEVSILSEKKETKKRPKIIEKIPIRPIPKSPIRTTGEQSKKKSKSEKK